MDMTSAESILSSLSHRHIITSMHFTKSELELIVRVSAKMEALMLSGDVPEMCKGNILATLFFEPSTRTRLSFESAMLRLGGKVITVEQGCSTSSEKGESLEDSGKIVSQYSDVIVMRHPSPGSVETLSTKSDVPVINAGDGPNEHPSQALLDLYTIYTEKGSIDSMKVGFLGDLKFGRTVHSLVKLLSNFDVEFVFVSHPSIALPDYILDLLKEKGCKVTVTDCLETAIKDLDVLYATRIQEERFDSKEEYKTVKDQYLLTQQILDGSKSELCLLHPLPRVNEISPEVDDDPKARYFKQAQNGVYLRMAILAISLGKIKPSFLA